MYAKLIMGKTDFCSGFSLSDECCDGGAALMAVGSCSGGNRASGGGGGSGLCVPGLTPK